MASVSRNGKPSGDRRDGGLAIQNLTRRKAPRAPFAAAADAVLPAWEISLVFVGEARARSLNKSLRGKDYVPNVLSYEVGQRSGEIIICLAQAVRQAPRYEMAYAEFVFYLFIHGLLHLKGIAHGATMERRERALVARFLATSRRTPTLPAPHGTKNRNRDRHRHVSGKAGRRRRGR